MNERLTVGTQGKLWIIFVCFSLLLSKSLGQKSDVFVKSLMEKYGSNGSLSTEQLTRLIESVRKLNRENQLSQKFIKCDNNGQNNCNQKKCLHAADLTAIYSTTSNGSSFTEQELYKAAPAIIYQAQNEYCHGTDSTANKDRHGRNKVKPSQSEVWGYGFLFVTIINLCSIIGIFILPCMGKSFYKVILMYMVALAVGSLVGSALLFLIPDALGLSEIEEVMDDYVWKSTTVMGGIYLFFIIERMLKSITEWRKKKGNKEDLDDCSLHQPFSASIKEHTPLPNEAGLKVPPNMSERGACPMSSTNSSNRLLSPDTPDIQNIANVRGKLATDSEKGTCKKRKEKKEIAPVAWMIIFGDALHNFIDGLSIGASFAESTLAGISISVAVICEEFPHELGDFAILLNSGMNKKQAVCFNFLSATTCYLGLMIGIVLGESTFASKWIFAIAGGMFLYISLADMMPEVNHAAEDEDNQKIGKLKIFIIQNLGLLSGYGVMIILAYFGRNIDFGT